MPLKIVATPLGNNQDLSPRAHDALSSAEVIIGEEAKATRRRLKAWDIPLKEIYLLNEHSDTADVEELAKICAVQDVALVSDCGTPGFCDPAAALVKLCRRDATPITSLPGAASLTLILSMSSEAIHHFKFVGFLPANKEKRQVELKKLQKLTEPMIIMDTPYRLQRLCTELAQAMPQRKALLGFELTTPEECYIESRLDQMQKKLPAEKGAFIILIYATSPSTSR